MTDRQLLLAIRLRANKRLSNFLLFRALDGLIEMASYAPLEEEVVQAVINLCLTYKLQLDDFDLSYLNKSRKKLTDKGRKKMMLALGLRV
jgi:hypothetical protein